MGIYLSTPDTTIEAEEGSADGIRYGVADMQGWRKNMEDAHLTLLDLNRSVDEDKQMMSLFGVFDGHGGKEVAKFTRLRYPETLVNLEAFKRGDYESALRQSFHRIDELLEDKQYDVLLKELRALPNPSDIRDGKVTGREALSVSYTNNSPLTAAAAGDEDDVEGQTTVFANTNTNAKPSTDSKNNVKKDSNSISTAEAVEMIRSILNKRSLKQDSDAADPVAAAEKGQGDEEEDKERSVTKTGGPYQASIKTENGGQCNLQDHRVMAGCTSIVAFLVGGKLYVANAGDSRGVLCRKGNVALPLSYDHKPQDSREMNRITQSGGFVNSAGRINGNLNLSRSLGDLKYKQNPHITPPEQMITAEPDITCTELEASDRFFILACDGIWDCLSCQEAVDFVAERLDQGCSPQDIATQMCLHCLSEDPRHSAGIGGDNMTAMVVVLGR